VFVKADIVRSKESFEDMEILTTPYKEKVKDSEDKYNRLPLIPGIPAEKPKDQKSALDD
jgi:hypothetical protein